MNWMKHFFYVPHSQLSHIKYTANNCELFSSSHVILIKISLYQIVYYPHQLYMYVTLQFQAMKVRLVIDKSFFLL